MARGQFFEGLRRAIAGPPRGLVRAGDPTTPAELAHAEKRLGRPLPASLAALLRSWNGVDLFHEAVVIHGTGPRAATKIEDVNAGTPGHDLVFAEAAAGDRFALDADHERVWRLRAGSDERWLSGSALEPWLDAMIAREQLLLGPDGEYVEEAFEPDGEELIPVFALRQAERALRKDPGSAEAHHDRAVALRRIGRLTQARDAFAQAAELDPTNPWPPFDLGRTELALDQPAAAAQAFEAAALAAEAADVRARMWAHVALAARAGEDEPGCLRARDRAIAAEPTLPQALRRAFEAASADGDLDSAHETGQLVAVFDEAPAPAPRRLPVVAAPPAPKPKPASAPPPGRPARPPRQSPARDRRRGRR